MLDPELSGGAGQLAWAYPASVSGTLWLQVGCSHSFFVSVGDLDPSPHTFQASSLSTEPSLQPPALVLRTISMQPGLASNLLCSQ